MPKISVIVPVYKVEPYLRKCIDSILSQTFRDFELILVDDGSPDQCGEICDEYAENHDNVVVIHQTNGGLSAARNSGIDWAFANSNSQWIAFVDSDDWLHPEYLSTLLDEAKKNNADLVVCDFVRVSDTEEIIEEKHAFDELVTSDKDALFRYLYANWRIRPAWNKLYRKMIFEELHFQVGKIHEDEFIVHHILHKCSKAAIIRQGLYFYRARPNSIVTSESSESRLDGLEAILEEYEFCIHHQLPCFEHVVYSEYMCRVFGMRKYIDRPSTKRYRTLKVRYAKIFFAKKTNRRVKSILKFGYYWVFGPKGAQS